MINRHNVDDLSEVLVCLVIGKGQVLASAEDDRKDIGCKQLGNDGAQGKIGVGEGIACFDISEVDDPGLEGPGESWYRYFRITSGPSATFSCLPHCGPLSRR